MAAGAKVVAPRIAAAVDLLAVRPNDHMLEIGCGNGTAAALVCERLVDGRFMGIDRSEKQVRLARQRNLACIGSGKATFHAVALEEATLREMQFDKIFAINVNTFWLSYEKPLAAVKQLLKPKGRFFIFYQQPTTAKMRDVSHTLRDNLVSAGFTIKRESSDQVYCLESMLPARRTS